MVCPLIVDCQSDYQRHIIVRRAPTASGRAAPLTPMRDNVSLFRIGLGSDRTHFPSAVRRSVPRILIQMERPQAKRTVVARGISERRHCLAAIPALEALVVFRKALCFHQPRAFSTAVLAAAASLEMTSTTAPFFVTMTALSIFGSCSGI